MATFYFIDESDWLKKEHSEQNLMDVFFAQTGYIVNTG